ncbi:MAG: DJ-1/PfpI family protein [Euryarchaeota archaeon]|nr:DJ-1/PfpI family protein [Euryarchaeota archaeon]
MPKVVVLLAPGFEEVEMASIVDTLRRAGIDVTLAGLQSGTITGAHGLRVIADTLIDTINPEKFDSVILPGGSPGWMNLKKDNRVIKLVQEFNKKRKIIAAICGASSVLAAAGVLKDKRATIYPGMESELTDAKPASERVVVDGKIITSQGPGTAIEFGLKLAEILVSKSRAEDVKRAMVVK